VQPFADIERGPVGRPAALLSQRSRRIGPARPMRGG
jgi:hypothetical protein